MTAEICVMNRLAVALAADSAVTLGSSAEKIYTSADKLFQLSETAPVGLMIFGNASFVGLPWETIVKSYRQKLGTTTYGTIDEYSANLIGFLSREHLMFPRSTQSAEIQLVIRRYYLRVLEEVGKRLKGLKKAELNDLDIKQSVASVVEQELKAMEKAKRYTGFDARLAARLRSKHMDLVNDIRKAVFGKLPMTRPSSMKLLRLGQELITRRSFGAFFSGVVVAGFGEKEYLPSVSSIAIESMIENHPRFYPGPKEKIGETSQACVIPFAQQEMVQTFMEGMDREMLSLIQSSTSDLFKGVMNNILIEADKSVPSTGYGLAVKYKSKLDDLLNELFASWKQRCEQEHWGPIMSIVSALPKDELASMAESLVNLTKFKRRVSTQKESVGGPIDVAVITKGDGFIWVKRKHYFESALNPRAMARYNRGGT